MLPKVKRDTEKRGSGGILLEGMPHQNRRATRVVLMNQETRSERGLENAIGEKESEGAINQRRNAMSPWKSFDRDVRNEQRGNVNDRRAY